MDKEKNDLEAPTQKMRSPWEAPALTLWAFAPALLMAGSLLGGWYASDGFISPGQRYEDQAGLGVMVLFIGFFGMPFVLYPWGIVVLRRNTKLQFAVVALIAIPLSVIMCGVNSFAAFAGCSVLTNVVPKEGIF
jgi:hypothetical protein